MDYVLWLASWYPNTLTPFDGDFIQRHARAASLFNKIVVIHLQKDTDAVVTKNIKEVIHSSGNLTEIIVFYHPLKTGIKILNKIISAKKYKKVYRSVLKKYLNENEKPKLVHVHVAMKAGLQALYLKKVEKIPYIITEHWSGYYFESEKNIYNSGWLQKKLTKTILKHADLLLTVAKSLEIAINKLVNVPYKVVSNVVDTNYFFYNPIQQNKFRFIHVSSMHQLKNPQGIIKAAKLLADEQIEFELFMIGSNRIELVSLAKELQLLNHQVFFKDEMSYKEVALEMQASSSFILFSHYESLPCVILEALCCGLPVISSDVGGVSEAVNDNNGILVQSKNEYQLKEAMKNMILNYSFYNRKKIADNASSKYNYTVVGEEIANIYKQIGAKN